MLIFFTLIVVFIILEYTNFKEGFMNLKSNNVHIIGDVNILNSHYKLNRIKTTGLCINNPYDNNENLCLTKEITELHKNLPNARKSAICIGNICINDEHLRILRGESPFQMKLNNNGSKVLQNMDLYAHGGAFATHDDGSDGDSAGKKIDNIHYGMNNSNDIFQKYRLTSMRDFPKNLNYPMPYYSRNLPSFIEDGIRLKTRTNY